MFTTRVLAIVAVVFAAVVFAAVVPAQPSTVPLTQKGELSPGESVQYATTTSVSQTLTITNYSRQEAAQVQINCSSWHKAPMSITLKSFMSSNYTETFGGAPILISNVTNLDNPAEISVMLNIVR